MHGLHLRRLDGKGSGSHRRVMVMGQTQISDESAARLSGLGFTDGWSPAHSRARLKQMTPFGLATSRKARIVESAKAHICQRQANMGHGICGPPARAQREDMPSLRRRYSGSGTRGYSAVYPLLTHWALICRPSGPLARAIGFCGGGTHRAAWGELSLSLRKNSL